MVPKEQQQCSHNHVLGSVVISDGPCKVVRKAWCFWSSMEEASPCFSRFVLMTVTMQLAAGTHIFPT